MKIRNPFRRRLPLQTAVAVVNEATGEKILLTPEQARAEMERLDARVERLAVRLSSMPSNTPAQQRKWNRTYQEAVSSQAAADGIRGALE